MKKPHQFLVVVIIILVIYALAAGLQPAGAFLLDPSEPGQLNDNWQSQLLMNAGADGKALPPLRNDVTLQDNGQPQSTSGNAGNGLVTLPVKLNIPANESVLLSTTLPASFSQPQHLLIRSSLQTLEVWLGDVRVYRAPFLAHPLGFMPYASVWNLVPLPADAAGQTLTLVVTSPFPQMSGRFHEIRYGHADTLLFHIVSKYGMSVFFILFLLFAGVFMLILLIVSRSIRVWTLMYLGAFSILIGLWILAESRMLQFVTGNQFVHASLAYVSLALLPIAMVLYIREIVSSKYHRLLAWLKTMYYVNFIVIVALQVLDVYSFFQSIIFTHGAILIGIVVCLYVIIQESVKAKNRDAQHLLLSFSVLPVFGLIEMIVFYTADFSQTSIFVRFGLFLFILLQSIQVSFHIKRNWEKSRKADLYEELAYTDSLTLAPNRQAFERDLHRAFADKANRNNLWIGIFDLNNLKLINDHHGHAKGDEALRRVYTIIDSVCSAYGVCYRIGGDEFACILRHAGVSAGSVRKMAEQIDAKAAEHQGTVDYPFEIALGFEACRAEDET
jgi:diguanylate cyclase (GGDEF)-like protein